MEFEGANPASLSKRHKQCVGCEGFKAKILERINEIREMRRHTQAERDRMRAEKLKRGLRLEPEEQEERWEEEERKLEPLKDIDVAIWNKMEPEVDLLMNGKESSYYEERVVKKTYGFSAYWDHEGPFYQVNDFLGNHCFPSKYESGDMCLDAIMDLNGISNDMFNNGFCNHRSFLYINKKESAKMLGIYKLWYVIGFFAQKCEQYRLPDKLKGLDHPEEEDYEEWVDPRKIYDALDRVIQLFFGIEKKDVITFRYINDEDLEAKDVVILNEIQEVREDEDEEDEDDDLNGPRDDEYY